MAKQKMEVLIWQGNGFACMSFRKAGDDSVPANVKRASIDDCKAEAEKKLAEHSIAIAWRQAERLSTKYSFGGWIGSFER